MLLQRNIGLQMEFKLIECGSSQIVRNILLLNIMQFIHLFNVSVQIVFNVHPEIIPTKEQCLFGPPYLDDADSLERIEYPLILAFQIISV